MIGRRGRGQLNAYLEEFRQIVVWGAGSSGKIAFSLLGDKIGYFVDSFNDGGDICGIPVKKPEELREAGKHCLVVIASISFREIEKQVAADMPDVTVTTLHTLLTRHAPRDSEPQKLHIDLVMYYQNNWFETWLSQPQLSVNITYRICRALAAKPGWWRSVILIPARIWHSLTCAFFGIELPVTAAAGAGLQFIHYGGIVIHDDAKLGEFCRIYQNVTLGSDKRGGVPTLGNHVTMWAGAVAIGGCRLGDFTQVGANSICLGDTNVEDVSLAGQPAKPIGFHAKIGKS